METPYRFELFGEQHKPLRASFFCGEKALEEYLKTRARREMDHRIAVVYVLYDAVEGRIAGYYTLSSLSLELPEDVRRGLARYPEYPATLIGRLAVEESYQERGFYSMLWDVLSRVRARLPPTRSSPTPRMSGRDPSTRVTASCRYPAWAARDGCSSPWVRSRGCSRSVDVTKLPPPAFAHSVYTGSG